MTGRASTYARMALVLGSLGGVACDLDDAVDANPTGPSRFVGSGVTAWPSSVSAEFHPTANCPRDMPFHTRINVHVQPPEDVRLRLIGFEFVPRHGRRVRPWVFPDAFQLNNSVLLLLPVQTTHPISFPGEVKMSDTLVPAGASFTAPFRLQFDCGVPARGTLFVSVETASQRGTVDVARSSVPIGH
jgi:hypothetical protein